MDEKKMDEKSEDMLRGMAPYSAEVLDPFVLKQNISALQRVKVAILSVTLLPIRLLLMLLALSLAWLVGQLTMLGMPEGERTCREPMSGWRRRWAKPLVAELGRLMMFFGGWWWVPQRGRRAPRSEAPILVVAPHSSFLDTALVIALRCPGMVVKDTTRDAPLLGSTVKCSQPLFVKSQDSECRHRIADEIRKRVTSNRDWEQVLLFPEGGCGNRQSILQFKLGAFTPGVPVQPVFIRYKNNLDTITWAWDGPDAFKQMWLSLSQFRIYSELEFLPVYKPSEEEKQNPRLYADNVREYMAKWTGTPLTHFSVDDAPYIIRARQDHIPPTAGLVKLMKLRKVIGKDIMDPAKELHFLSEVTDQPASREGDADAMAAYLGLEKCPEALREFFNVLDQHKKKAIDFRSYAVGLCLLRTDLKPAEKIKAAMRVFGQGNGEEKLEVIFLLWKGIPASNLKFLNLVEKLETSLFTKP